MAGSSRRGGDRAGRRSGSGDRRPGTSANAVGLKPLHRDAATAKRGAGGNAGLWYDKFCDRWKPDWTGFAGDSGKRDWIEEIANIGAGSSPKKAGDAALLAEACRRIEALATNQGGKSFRAATVWRFAGGLGRSHPVENGFAWHHTLGTPYLAGSGLKGLARAYARDWKELPGLGRIFGPAPQGILAVGSVVFLDALPLAPVVLEADVMTPHYGPWYQKGEVPGDWHSPIPIPFLTVAKEQSFLFCLLPRSASAQDREDCGTVAGLLREALEVLGAGAKTAVGYGQFRVHTGDSQQTGTRSAMEAATHPHARESWVGREAVVYGEVVRVLEERGDRLLVRFPDGTEEEIEGAEARLR